MLKRFFDFILFGNIYIAIGAVCQIQSTARQLNFTDNLFSYSILTFFATLFIYNLQRVFYSEVKDVNLNSIRRKWIFSHPASIKILTLIGFIGVSLTFFSNDYRILFYLSPLLILSLAYFIPAIKLRKSPWFKMFTLVSVWTMTTAVVPLILNSSSNSALHLWQLILHTSLRFCFIMAICIPFDIRDIAIDASESVSTLPHLFGENKTRLLALFFLLIYIVLIILEFTTKTISLPSFIALLISMSATLVLIIFSNSKRSEYYFVAGIDGTMILQGVLMIICSMIK